MEYIDGEDLASLLKRIGRLPADKALDIARQIAAGLAAAHNRGVLHRDLKPANIMLDGPGIHTFVVRLVTGDGRVVQRSVTWTADSTYPAKTRSRLGPWSPSTGLGNRKVDVARAQRESVPQLIFTSAGSK